MNDALDLLSDDEDDAPENEATEVAEPDTKRQKLDFQDLKRLGYAVQGEEDEKAKMQNAFSSFEKMTEKPGAATEIPGFATTYQIVRPGDAVRVVEKGCKVIVHATGVMTKTGKVFWESRETQSGKPHLFLAGAGKRVVGWEQGCMGMKIGEVRKLSVPSHEGYGERGFSDWEIPPNCDLEFTIECLDIAATDEGGRKPKEQLPWWLPQPEIWRFPSAPNSSSFSADEPLMQEKNNFKVDAPAPTLVQQNR